MSEDGTSRSRSRHVTISNFIRERDRSPSLAEDDDGIRIYSRPHPRPDRHVYRDPDRPSHPPSRIERGLERGHHQAPSTALGPVVIERSRGPYPGYYDDDDGPLGGFGQEMRGRRTPSYSIPNDDDGPPLEFGTGLRERDRRPYLGRYDDDAELPFDERRRSRAFAMQKGGTAREESRFERSRGRAPSQHDSRSVDEDGQRFIRPPNQPIRSLGYEDYLSERGGSRSHPRRSEWGDTLDSMSFRSEPRFRPPHIHETAESQAAQAQERRELEYLRAEERAKRELELAKRAKELEAIERENLRNRILLEEHRPFQPYYDLRMPPRSRGADPRWVEDIRRRERDRLATGAPSLVQRHIRKSSPTRKSEAAVIEYGDPLDTFRHRSRSPLSPDRYSRHDPGLPVEYADSIQTDLEPVSEEGFEFFVPQDLGESAETDCDKESASVGKPDRLIAPPPSIYQARKLVYGIVDSKSQSSGSGAVTDNPSLVAEQLSSEGPLPHSTPLYLWIHIEAGLMSITEFVNAAAQAPYLDDGDRELITAALGPLQANEQTHRTANGTSRRYLPNTAYMGSGTGPRQKDKRVYINCFPYFSLERYAGGELPENVPLHTSMALLQTLYLSARKARDLQQAVCKLPGTSKGTCFHVSQIWTLLLDERLLVTCSRHSVREISDQAFNLTTTPESSAPSSGQPRDYIEVSDGGRYVWLLPIAKCQTWLAFTAHFRHLLYEEFEYALKVRLLGMTIDADDWPGVIAKSRTTFIRLTLSKSYLRRPHAPQGPKLDADLEQGPPVEDSDDDGLTVEEVVEEAVEEVGADRDERSSDGPTFHIFKWLNVVNPLGTDATNEARAPNVAGPSPSQRVDPKRDNISLCLSKAHDFLMGREKGLDRKRYEAAEEMSLAEANQCLATWRSVDRPEKARQDRQVVFTAAKDILQFFVPLDSDAQILRRYWGAIGRYIESDDDKFWENGRRWRLSELAFELTRMRTWLSRSKCPPPGGMKIPEEWQSLFLHVLMYVILLHANAEAAEDAHYFKCGELLLEGRRSLLRNLAPQALGHYEAVVPGVVQSLIAARLVRDVSRRDILDVYWDYFRRLELEIQGDPLKRAHQNKITFFNQEILAVQSTLEEQGRVLRQMEVQILEQTDRGDHTLPRAVHLPEPYDLPLIRDAIVFVRMRIRGCKELTMRAGDLSSWHLRMIESNKDRQDAAIYAFTVVTVIFLPLSFVTGFLGMNTSDVRDMVHRQWVFWVAGVPLTALIIVIALAWAGELGNAWRALGHPFVWAKRKIEDWTFSAARPPSPKLDAGVTEPVMPYSMRRSATGLTRRSTGFSQRY